ncbi:MAG: threonine/serine exporter family protein [Myxococcota bacterium]|nr:threonine/serine exporter family protein [Myxococcota bacterium]
MLYEAVPDAVGEDIQLIEELAAALHCCGAPAHRLEATIDEVSVVLDLDAAVFATPTALLISVSGQTRLVRVHPHSADLGRLVRVDALAADLISGRLSPGEALATLGTIQAAPPLHSTRAVIMAFGISGGSAALFFGGGLLDGLVALVLSLLIGIGVHWVAGSRLDNFLLAMAAALGAGLASTVLPVSGPVLILATLVVLLPGLSLTVALAELATGNLVSGTARLSGTGLTLLQLGMGAAVGGYLLPGTVPDVVVMRYALEPVAISLGGLGFTVLFQARWKDAPMILASCMLAFYGARLGGQWFTPLGGAFFGALLVASFSNLQARLRHVPASIALEPGILLLVPGSIGFRGLEALLAGQTVDGVSTGFAMVLTSAALVGGLLTASALVPARRAL